MGGWMVVAGCGCWGSTSGSVASGSGLVSVSGIGAGRMGFAGWLGRVGRGAGCRGGGPVVRAVFGAGGPVGGARWRQSRRLGPGVSPLVAEEDEGGRVRVARAAGTLGGLALGKVAGSHRGLARAEARGRASEVPEAEDADEDDRNNFSPRERYRRTGKVAEVEDEEDEFGEDGWGGGEYDEEAVVRAAMGEEAAWGEEGGMSMEEVMAADAEREAALARAGGDVERVAREAEAAERLLPRVAIVGRPNVGKSALFNRLTAVARPTSGGREAEGSAGSRDRLAKAIVYDEPGVTRDRYYASTEHNGRHFAVVDTGGLLMDEKSELFPLIREQALAALTEASVAVLVVDGQAGLTAADAELAGWLRKQRQVVPWHDAAAMAVASGAALGDETQAQAPRKDGKGGGGQRAGALPVVLAVNKCESHTLGLGQASEFWEMGLGEPMPVSALHGVGTAELLDAAVAQLPETPPEVAELLERRAQLGPPPTELNVAIVGRPNVGKSSILNALVGAERSCVSDVSGTTRDAIDAVIEDPATGRRFRLIDTAGIKRKKYVDFGPEFLGINRSFKAIRRADVVLLVLDASTGVSEQDARLANRIREEGRACIMVVNKWDIVPNKTNDTLQIYQKQLRQRLHWMGWAPILFVSAHTGQRLPKLLEAAAAVGDEFRRRVGTSVINEVMQDAVTWQAPPGGRGGRPTRLLYATQIKASPPTFLCFVNHVDAFASSPAYTKYMERAVREAIGFEGTPLRIYFRGRSQSVRT